MADAAAAAGVKVFVFNTLEDADKRSKVRSLSARAHFSASVVINTNTVPTQSGMMSQWLVQMVSGPNGL